MSSWNYNQIIVVVINVLGGMGVIGSYIKGIISHPGSVSSLWGGVPPSIRLYYGLGMLLSALGYFAFSYYILFRIDPDGLEIAGVFNYLTFAVLYFIILCASTVWMPLTYSFLDNPNHGTWISIRTVLFATALGTLLLLISLITMTPRELSASYWFAIAGVTVFFLHTGILDAFVWPTFFKR